MFKVRGLIGQALIINALGQFESISKKFEDGVKHCNAEMDNHQKDIAIKQVKIRELGQYIARANRVLDKLKAFTE